MFSTLKLFGSTLSKPSTTSKHSSSTPLINSELEEGFDEDDGLPEVIYVIPMRIIGFLLLAFGVVELVIGVQIYGILTNVTLGSWWCVPIVFICAFLALASNTKTVVLSGVMFGLIGCIFTQVAVIVDGRAAHTFYNYEACFSPATDTIYGDQSYKDFLIETCDSGSTANAHKCYCASDNDDLCWEYDLATTKHTCNILLTTYPYMLLLSFTFCFILLGLCVIYCVLAIVSACCIRWCMKKKIPTEEN